MFKNHRCITLSAITLSAAFLPLTAAAQLLENNEPDEFSGDASLSADSDDMELDADAEIEDSESEDSLDDSNDSSKKKSKTRWIDRWPPEDGMWELGIYGGVLLPNRKHEWFGPDNSLERDGFKPLGRLSPDVGARIGYYPKRFLGLEVEGGVMPSQVDADGGGNALLYTVRGHLLAQIPKWSVTPFILAGAGVVGVSSDRDALGNDVDPAFHFGGGVKIFFNRYVAMRLDLRDILSYGRGEAAKFRSNNFEALLGLSVTLGRDKEEPDTDGDGIVDSKDECVEDPETFNDFQDRDGCPESDRDGDGFWDDPDHDRCPDEPGIDPDGCPAADTDGDGILDEDDKCVDDPETKNGYEDEDGCPDELPEEIQKFSGVIRGIYFDNDKDSIKDRSTRVLNNAAEVLSKFSNVRVRITGHTDSNGGYEHNMDLSRRRAEAVKSYLVEHGIDESRMETAGVGPDEPIESNETAAGRAKNRRIEFTIISE